MFTGATSWPRRSSGCASRWRCSSRRDPSAAWRTLSAAVAVRFSTGHHRRLRGPSGRQYRRASARICVKRSRRSGLLPRQTHTVVSSGRFAPASSDLASLRNDVLSGSSCADRGVCEESTASPLRGSLSDSAESDSVCVLFLVV